MPRHLELWLASGSPRRRALLNEAGLPVRLAIPGDEPDGGPPSCPARALLRARAKARGARLPDAAIAGPEVVFLGVDTVVDLDGEDLGKPRNAAAARASLLRLAGRSHHVHSAAVLHSPAEGRCWERVDSARVDFGPLTAGPELERLIASDAWRGKAGGYGIQDPVFEPFVRLGEGSFDTVVGMHVSGIRELLEAAQGG